ncbi:MAG: sugar fermentation stimulation protein [Synergistaceae bacterium]|nr:sugar fermentation stimulation protein [Synergistaceae bacterium]
MNFAGFRAADPEKLRRARFIDRPNRFLVRCELEGRPVSAFLPNPGRLWEILLPGTELLLAEDGGSEVRKTAFTAVAALRGEYVVLLHTHIANDAAGWLIGTGRVPGLEGWKVKKREVSFGRSRFDFLLEKEGRLLLLEVKSCTLFGQESAMFPDAPSDRGRKHVEELWTLAGEGYEAALLFLVQSSRPNFFLPDFHTDPKFAACLFRAKDRLRLFPLAVEWNAALELTGEPKLLPVPWEVYERHGGDRGDCLVLVDAGEKGFWAAAFPTENLSSFAGKALRRNGKDFPFPPGSGGKVKVIPIRSSLSGSKDINNSLASCAAGEVVKEGVRYFVFSGPPMKNAWFVEMLLYRRTDLLLSELP